jgi:hypothetical protein
VEPYTPSQTLAQVTVLIRSSCRLRCHFGNLRQSPHTTVLARARTARRVPRGQPHGNSNERLSSACGASRPALPPAAHSPRATLNTPQCTTRAMGACERATRRAQLPPRHASIATALVTVLTSCPPPLVAADDDGAARQPLPWPLPIPTARHVGLTPAETRTTLHPHRNRVPTRRRPPYRSR